MPKLRTRWTIAMFAILALASACAPAAPQERAATTSSGSAAQKRTAVLGVSSAIPAFSFAYVGTSGGGSQSFDELWRQGLVTTARTSTAPEPRIAAELPSIDRGTAVLLPDGRLRTTWRIRPEVRWADGTDLTAHDYAFGLEVMKDPQNPLAGAILVVNIAPLIETLEVLDDKSFVLTWRRPFYMFDSLGFFALQPVPTHVLRGIWDERNFDGFGAHPYWRAEYFQVGPYRPIKFEPQTEIVLEAVPHYFLGKPKIDTLILKQTADANVLYAAVLAGAVHLTGDNSIGTEHAMELKDHWGKTGEGRVYIGYGTTRAIFPMFNPETQAEPAMLDPRVRQALYMAVDKETWATAMLSGNREMVSHSLLPPSHSLYEFTKDSFRGFSYEPERAIRMLDDLGWTRGADGSLRNRTDGRPFKQEIWTGAGTEGEASILSDMWRAIGLQPNIFIPRTAQSDRILGQSIPGRGDLGARRRRRPPHPGGMRNCASPAPLGRREPRPLLQSGDGPTDRGVPGEPDSG